jgi:hypothetical protein
LEILMEKPLFSVRLEPAPGSSFTYRGETILARVTIENTGSSPIALAFERAQHDGVFVKLSDANDPTRFAYTPRCPGDHDPDEPEEALTTIVPGSSVSFLRPITRYQLEQLRRPEEDVDVDVKLTLVSKVLVGDEWKEQRAEGSARITGRRDVTK